jgi:hypothetical protein
MPRTQETARFFVDDGYPEARDYDNNYVVVVRPVHGGFWRAVRTRLLRGLRLHRRLRPARSAPDPRR